METYNSFKETGSSQESLESFRKEIQELQQKELEKKKAAENPNRVGNPDLLGIEVDQLTEDDMRIWQNYKKLTVDNITEKDIQDFENYKGSIDAKKTPGRKSFAAFVINKLTAIWGEKQLRDMEKWSF